ncbi:short chain dehydrogenase [Patulibacter medicamentivorans]|uniref:Short chain dehydrogenase n=1 Tax=Patulibacter medicamentivorans TaxID=1097667 RepID=H0E6M3_9ACTN|nr:SDR family oxidoreductase [Patulibacter medicamentivorans]EHN10670.1 short chain dehydrogenase [Patulibacter medicamentivorans]
MPAPPIPLDGRVVAITGAARGIGRATAAALVRKGARVAIGDLDPDLAQKAADALGGGTIAIALDVTDRASFDAFLTEAERRLGPLDVLINNAGIMPIARQLDESDATARRILDINVHGVIFGSKLALARMLPRDRGHIVNVASQAGKASFGGLGTYCASKHAVVGYTGSLADELRDSRVHASCVMPAVVRTELSQGLPTPKLLEPIEPEDVADAIVATLERPRLNVHVPRSGGAVLAAMNAMPPRARRGLERALGMEHGVMAIDPASRGAYEARAARTVSGVHGDEAAPPAGVSER